MPDLAISAEKVAFLIEKAREFDAKEMDADPDSGSSLADDDAIDVLEDNGSDPVATELSSLDAFGIDWTDEPTSADSSSPSERSEDDPIRGSKARNRR